MNGSIALAMASALLCEQARVSVVRVDDRPVVGVIEVTLSVPDEALEPLPVARRFLGGIFQGHFAKCFMVISAVRGVLISHPSPGCRLRDDRTGNAVVDPRRLRAFTVAAEFRPLLRSQGAVHAAC